MLLLRKTQGVTKKEVGVEEDMETEEDEDISMLDVEVKMGKWQRDKQQEGIKYP
jgi:hypothetical protein